MSRRRPTRVVSRTAPSAPDVLAGLRHERFRIGDKLGEGGMGVVYRARDSRDGREVALKLMKGTLAGTARRRFEREFRSLSALQPSRTASASSTTASSTAARSSPWSCSRAGRSPAWPAAASREVLDPLLQVTHALDYIHDHGIVHRDVKPSNILVRPATRPDGSPGFETRLMDFGLAKYYGVKSSLSAEAGFVGTVAYCAPEQLNLDELDHRADLYCLGLVSYELLSGRYPFPEARLAGMRPLMQAQLNDKPQAAGRGQPRGARADRRRGDEVPAQAAAAPARLGRTCCASRSPGYLGIDDQSRRLRRVDRRGCGRCSRSPASSAGRSEQEALDDVLRRCLRPARPVDAARSPASLIVVSGEPGIGKSSVVQEAERIARGHGCQVYEGRCFDGNLSPFQPFVEIIRQLIAELRLQERREAAPRPTRT